MTPAPKTPLLDVHETREGAMGEPAPKRQVPGVAGEFLRYFDTQHQRVFALPYCSVVGRDLKALHGPLRVYGLPRLCVMAERFFDEQERALRPKEPNAFGVAFQEKYGGGESWIGKAKPDVLGFIRQIPNLAKRFDFTNGE